MTMTKSRRASTTEGRTAALPSLTGRWSEAEIQKLSDEMLRDLDLAGVGASSPVAQKGLQIVVLGAWLVAHKQRTEEWLRIAFDRIASLEAQIAGHKSAKLPYRGVWRAGHYQPGSFVTHKGGLWHCDQETTAKPGDDPEAWTLAVKSGDGGAQLLQKTTKILRTYRDEGNNLLAEVIDQGPFETQDARP